MTHRVFADRKNAGKALANALRQYRFESPVVLGLPRGGVPVAFEVAAALSAPLDVIVVRKLGAPIEPELAIGAIGSGGVCVLNDDLIRAMPALDESGVAHIIARERRELQRREQAFRGDRPLPDLAGRDVILVDDGLATGATMNAAVEVVRSIGPRSITIAVPTASAPAARKLRGLVDRFVSLQTRANFEAVGLYYDDFGQTTDREVRELLDLARQSGNKGATNESRKTG